MVSFYTKFELWRTHSFGDISLAFVTKASSVSMQFYSCVSIILPLSGFANCMFEASRCCAGRIAKGRRGSKVTNVEPDAGSSARSCARKWE